MIAIANKNKVNNKFLPMISLIENEKELKKRAKFQIMKEILNDPRSIKAYKEIETYKIAEIDENMEIKTTKKKLLFTYEEIINEIIEQLTKEQEKENETE